MVAAESTRQAVVDEVALGLEGVAKATTSTVATKAAQWAVVEDAMAAWEVAMKMVTHAEAAETARQVEAEKVALVRHELVFPREALQGRSGH
jgi:hypothetical protein